MLAGQEHPEVVWVAREHDAVGGAMASQTRDRRSGQEGVESGVATRLAEQQTRVPGELLISWPNVCGLQDAVHPGVLSEQVPQGARHATG